MKIPTGDFGYRVPETVRGPRPRQGPSPIVGALQDAGRVLGNVAEDERQMADQVSRLRLANASADGSLYFESGADDIVERLTTQQLKHDQADAVLKELADGYQMPEGLDPLHAATFKRGIERAKQSATQKVRRASFRAMQNEAQSGSVLLIDKLEKRAGMPGQDVAKIAGELDLLAPTMRAGGMPEDAITKTIQDARDRMWTNHATQRAMEAREDSVALDQLRRDLTEAEGFYAGKLDTERRNSVVNTIDLRLGQIEYKLAGETAKREAKAGRAVTNIENQIVNGVPLTAEMWQEGSELVKGTEAESRFAEMQKLELEVQDVLRSPLEDQDAYVNRRDAELATHGGSLVDKANVDRLRRAVEANKKLLQEDPLQFAAKRTGTAVEPLDLGTALAEPEGATQLTAHLQERMTTLTAMRGEYGDAVQLKPLLAPEADFVSRALKTAPPAQQAQLLGLLRAAAGDLPTYQAVMSQIGPGNPVLALAGLRMSAEAPPAGVTGPQVAETMLLGQSLLTKIGADGKPKAVNIPGAEKFNKKFDQAASELFAGNHSAYRVARQAVMAYYMGTAANRGFLNDRPAGDSIGLDTELFDESFAAVVGKPVEFGPWFGPKMKVLPPWGMSEDAFEEAMGQRISAAIQGAGYDRVRTEALLKRAAPRNLGDGTYRLVFDGEFVTDPRTGKDLVINLREPPKPVATKPAAPAPGQPEPQAAATHHDVFKQVAAAIPGATITSLNRTPEKNKAVHGVTNSQHLSGTAADFQAPPEKRAELMTALRAMGYEVIDEYKTGRNHIHAELPPRASRSEIKRFAMRLNKWMAGRQAVTGGSGGARG